MTFDYIVYRYLIHSSGKKVLGGFLNLKAAQEFIVRIDGDYLSSGFFYIDSPAGKYIYGDNANYNKSGHIWYEPGQEAYVYNSIKDDVVHIDEVVSFDF